MAIHLTPTELARESGLERRDVIVKCVEWGIPIFNGRIDKTLFLSSFREITGSAPQSKQQPSSPSGLRSHQPLLHVSPRRRVVYS